MIGVKAIALVAAIERGEDAERLAAVEHGNEQRRARIVDAEPRGGNAQARGDVGDPLGAAAL